MAYSNNVKQLILTIVRQGRSPETTIEYLSQHISDDEAKNYPDLKKLADSLSIPFTPMDCHEIYMSLPSSKTIRNWISEEPNPENQNQFGLKKIEAECIGILNDQGKYPEEWKHFNKFKEAIIKLQYVSESQVGELLDLIERERITLDDSVLQKDLDEFIVAIQECVDLHMSIPHDLITPIISHSAQRMNKRYKRR